jgi:hypothetical protein
MCRHCGTECVPVKAQAPQPIGGTDSFYKRLPGAFLYPFKGSGVFVMIVCTIVVFGLGFMLDPNPLMTLRSGVWFMPIFSIFAWMAFYGYIFTFMQSIIHATASGDEEMPGFPPFDDLGGNFVQFAGAAAVSFCIPITLFVITVFSEDSTLGGQFMLPAMVLGCIYFPMAILAVAMKGTPLAANPLIVIPAIFKAPVEYLLTTIVLAGVMGLRALGDPVISAVFPRGLTTHNMAKMFGYLGACSFWKFATIYLLAVNMRILGLLYIAKKHKFGWFER